MLDDLLGITSTETILMWTFLITGLIFGIPVVAIVLIARYRSKAALARFSVETRRDDPNFEYDVFLSYSSEDRQHAADLAAKMETSGIKVYFADKSLQAGSPFTEEIRKALHGSREVWLLASRKSIASTWVATEWGTAWALNRKIVPILLDVAVVDLPDRLKALQTTGLERMEGELANAQRRFARSPGKA